jgi:hypothetical protein
VNKFSTEDRRHLIRFASQMPVGSPERRAILSGLRRSFRVLRSPTPSPQDARRIEKAVEELGLTREHAWGLFEVSGAVEDHRRTFPDDPRRGAKRDWVSMARADARAARYGNAALGRYYDIVVKGMK